VLFKLLRFPESKMKGVEVFLRGLFEPLLKSSIKHMIDKSSECKQRILAQKLSHK